MLCDESLVIVKGKVPYGLGGKELSILEHQESDALLRLYLYPNSVPQKTEKLGIFSYQNSINCTDEFTYVADGC